VTNGFTEKMKKTYHYIRKTISKFFLIKLKIQNKGGNKYLAGERNCSVAGTGELLDLAERTIKNLKHKELNYTRVAISAGGQDRKSKVRSARKADEPDILIAGDRKFPLLPIVAKS
jgi:hypothetical protein